MYPTTDRKLIPYLFYEDLGRAIPWVCDVFGFQERFRLQLPNGAIAHAEIENDGGVIMLGNVGARNAKRPASVRSSIYVFVPNVDAHFAASQAKGAMIIAPPAEQPFGDRIYLASDLEGHEWYFAQHLRDVAIASLKERLGGGSRPA